MEDLENAILDAWNRVKSKILADPPELQRRLDRRTRPVLLRPPRVWCLAVRASDLRLRAPLVRVDPETALDPAYHNGHFVRHELTITTEALRARCEPVYIDGLTLEQAAARLGLAQGNLLDARIKGTLRAKYPTKRGFETADEAWDWTGQFYPQRVPENFSQTITRIPLERSRAGGQRYRDTRGLHPEHPLLDPPDVAPPRKRKLLPPAPTQDICAWYKWKGDEYVGYDWRNSHATANYERHEREKAMKREADRARRRERGPAPSKSRGSLMFQGWRWLCPRCGRSASTIYLPLTHVNLLANWPSACDELARAGVPIHAPQPAPSFACDTCHRPRGRTPTVGRFWNHLISVLSGGLLYGREVPRPPWLAPKRKVPFHPRPDRPAPRRLAIEGRLIKGWSDQQIAADLGILPRTVRHTAVLNLQTTRRPQPRRTRPTPRPDAAAPEVRAHPRTARKGRVLQGHRQGDRRVVPLRAQLREPVAEGGEGIRERRGPSAK